MTQESDKEFGNGFVACFPTVFQKCICDGTVFIQQLDCCGRTGFQYIHLLDIVVLSQHIHFGLRELPLLRKSELKS